MNDNNDNNKNNNNNNAVRRGLAVKLGCGQMGSALMGSFRSNEFRQIVERRYTLALLGILK